MTDMLDPMFVYRDRYAAVDDSPIDLLDLVAPGFDAPTSWAITAGNSDGHLALATHFVDFSAAGAAADMASGTYTLTIEATWSALPAAYQTSSTTLTIVCPGDTRYIDPATGDDGNAGTKDSPWAHAPGDPNATGNAAGFAPASLTLLHIKGGGLISSNILVPANDYLVYASGLGWGDGKAILSGLDLLSAGTAASSDEAFANANLANIKKYAVADWVPAQYIVDNGALIYPAQWPAAGTDKLLDSQDPQRHLTGGMYRYSATDSTGWGTASTVIGGDAAAAILAAFGAHSLVGYVVWHWVNNNQTVPYVITAHDTSTGEITFDSGDDAQTNSSGVSAFQIVGHPWSISAADQFAGKQGDDYVLAWLSDGTAPEILSRKVGINYSAAADIGIYGLLIQGYYNDTNVAEGCGIAVARSSDWSSKIANNEIRWIVNNVKASAIRTTGIGNAVDNILDRNYCHDLCRASGIRHSNKNTDNAVVVRNRIERGTQTGMYITNLTNSLIRANSLKDLFGAHANGYTFYKGTVAPTTNVIQYNTTEDVIRPLTADVHLDTTIEGNIFESDGINGDHVRFYSSDGTETLSRNMFMRRRDVALPGAYGLNVDNDLAFSNNVIDGIVLQSPYEAVGTDNLVTNFVAGTGADDDLVDGVSDKIGGLGSGNVYQPQLWDGGLTPAMKQTLGVGRIGNQLIYSIAVVDFPALAAQAISTVVSSGWALVDTSDATRPISLSGDGVPEWRQADDAAGANATAWSSADGTIDAAKYLQIRQTTSASNDADQTATIDLGDDNVSTWTVRTMKARDIPWVTIDATDAWQTPSGSALGADSQKFTLAMKLNLTAIQSGTNTIFGVSAGSLWFQIQTLLSTNAIRISGRNASNVTVVSFDIAGLSTGVDYDLLATCDLTQATGAAGLVAYLNGAVISPSNVTFTSDETIHFSGTTTQRFGYLHLQADFGYLYLSNRLVDITSADIRERFSNGRRFGANGENVDGAAPMVLLMGTKAQWEDAGGVNRGTSTPKWIAQSGTGVTPVDGTVTDWPYYAYATTLELTAPADINLGDTAGYVLSVDGVLANDVSVTLSDDGAGGTFSLASPITLANADVPSLTFDYTPASAGNKTISASGSGLTGASDVLGVVAPAVSVTYNFEVTIHDASGAAADITEPLSLTLNP